ncbi:hypothetical protein K435DRAFT_571266, partial [Dendrothele bispora CBS 962.96]
ERLQASWNSSIYSFFSEKVNIGHDKGRKYHYFSCKAARCKGTGGVRRYLDGSDRSSTSNLRKHAIHCFGKDAVDAAKSGAQEAAAAQNTIYAMFAGTGDRLVHITHRTHTGTWKFAANVVRWVTESCRPLRIVDDRKLRGLMLAGRPQASFP